MENERKTKKLMCYLNIISVERASYKCRVTIVISSHWWGLGEDVIPFRCYGKLSRVAGNYAQYVVTVT